MKLSIIIPAFNEEENVNLIYKNIDALLESINYEIIFVNDGSTDKTYDVLANMYKEDKRHIKVVDFSRNFGKDAAIYAGLEKSSGEYTAIIDADMQQDPKYLIKMMDFLEKNKNYDEVAMVIKERKDGSKFKRWCAKRFYKFMNKMSDIHFEEDASDFRMIRRNIKDAILKMPEKNRFSKGIFNWVGFNIKYMPYDVKKRTKGESKFNLRKSFRYGIDGIIGYSVKPLKLATITGVIVSLAAFIYLIYIIIKVLVVGVDTPGFATIVCLILIIGGFELTSIGILGEYIAKIYIETKNRPIYVENKSLGFDDDIL